jgi:hypothetical protein
LIVDVFKIIPHIAEASALRNNQAIHHCNGI